MVCDDSKGQHWAILTAVGGLTSTTRETKETSSSSYNIPANTKASIDNGSARQSNPYGNNQFPATNAWAGGNKFTHTNRGVGQWWEVKMTQSYWIDRVRIRNRHNCCPERLGGTKVFVDGKEGGQVTGRMSRGQWTEVKFSKPLYGRTIRLVTT
jgi:hypothetical protein